MTQADTGADSGWCDAEDWALLDSTPSFTVGRDKHVVTFWQAMAASTPELSVRSAAECERRWTELTSCGATASIAVGQQPAVLEEWSRLPDGRVSGRLSGEASAVWLTVAMEGRLASDPRDGPGYIEAIGGRIYELARPSVASSAALAPPSAPDGVSAASALAASLGGALTMRLPYAAVGVLLAGAIGFGAGTSVAPPPPPLPPPPPQITKVVIAQQAPPSSTRAAPAKTPLTIREQRERAALRVDSDKARLQVLQQRIKEDEQVLSEYRRVERQQGGDADAVRLDSRLIFPDQLGPKGGARAGP